MNILLICHELPPVGGGTGNKTMAVGREMAKQHAVTILTSTFRSLPKHEVRDGLTIVRTPSLRRRIYGMSPFELLVFTLSAIPAALRLHRQRRYDWCIAFHGIPAAWVSVVLWKLCRVPYMVALGGPDVPGFLPEKFDRLHKMVNGPTKLSWRNARSVVAGSDGLRKLAERTAQTIGVQVDMIPNGVDVDFYRPRAENRGTGTLKALFVGRLTEQKGLIYLFRALKEKTTELKGALSIEIVGDGNLKEALIGYAGEAGLSNMVTFAPWLEREELRKKYQSSSFFVLPSLNESRSIAILEAMACGLPVVASSVGGTPELLQDGVNGFLVPPRDPAALGEVLVRMATMDQGRLETMGRASRERAEGYSWSKITQSYLAYLSPGRSAERAPFP